MYIFEYICTFVVSFFFINLSIYICIYIYIHIFMGQIYKYIHGYKKCDKKCDSCNNFVDETSFVILKATGRKYCIRRGSTCTTKNVIYLAYCTKCGEQGTGSTVYCKPRLSNYKSHIKQSAHSCKIVTHFIEKSNNPIVPFKYLRFIILDVLTNTESLSKMILKIFF